jgi:hypothetical protein
MSLDLVIKGEIKSGFEKLFGQVLTEKGAEYFTYQKGVCGRLYFCHFSSSQVFEEKPGETAQILGRRIDKYIINYR